MTDSIENVFKVKLYSQTVPSRRVVFDVTPDITESTNVDYRSIQPVHMPGTIYVYGSTTARTFDVSNIRLVSRTTEEASKNLQYVQYLRSWTKGVFGVEPYQTDIDQTNPNFSKHAATSYTFENTADLDILGAPPESLYLTAYSDEQKLGVLQNLNRIPVSLQTLGIPYPSDKDYVNTEDGIPVPIVWNISLTLIESHSPLEYEKFSLSDYRKGNLQHF